MKYIFYQHYYIDPEMSVPAPKKILLAEPEPEARALYHRHLALLNAVISVCQDISQLLTNLQTEEPDLLVVNPGTNPSRSLAFLKSIKKTQPALRIITIGYGTPDEYLDRFMEVGVSAHINRFLTRPQDVAATAQQVLAGTYSLNT